MYVHIFLWEIYIAGENECAWCAHFFHMVWMYILSREENIWYAHFFQEQKCMKCSVQTNTCYPRQQETLLFMHFLLWTKYPFRPLCCLMQVYLFGYFLWTKCAYQAHSFLPTMYIAYIISNEKQKCIFYSGKMCTLRLVSLAETYLGQWQLLKAGIKCLWFDLTLLLPPLCIVTDYCRTHCYSQHKQDVNHVFKGGNVQVENSLKCLY